MNEKKVIRKVTLVGVIGNIALVGFKLFAGIFGKSGAMISDAVHSLSDVFATLIAAFGVKISKKEADKDHPYGHDRFECLASLALGLILLVTGAGIGYTGIHTILHIRELDPEPPKMIALAAAIVSIVTKEAMFRYTRYYARKINSSAFMADAWHHRSDAASSVGSLIGIAGAMLGVKVLDPIAGVVIALLIIKVSIDILKDAVRKLLDTACSEEKEQEIRGFIEKQPGVREIDVLRTRQFGEMIYVEAEIGVDGELKLTEAHRIAEQVHDAIEREFPEVKHILIHENPKK